MAQTLRRWFGLERNPDGVSEVNPADRSNLFGNVPVGRHMTLRQLQARLDESMLEQALAAHNQRERTVREEHQGPRDLQTSQAAPRRGSMDQSAHLAEVIPNTVQQESAPSRPAKKDRQLHLLSRFEDAHGGLASVVWELAAIMQNLGESGQHYLHDYSQLLHEYTDASLQVSNKLQRMKMKMELTGIIRPPSNRNSSAETQKPKLSSKSSSVSHRTSENNDQSNRAQHHIHQQTPKQRQDTPSTKNSPRGGGTGSSHTSAIGTDVGTAPGTSSTSMSREGAGRRAVSSTSGTDVGTTPGTSSATVSSEGIRKRAVSNSNGTDVGTAPGTSSTPMASEGMKRRAASQREQRQPVTNDVQQPTGLQRRAGSMDSQLTGRATRHAGSSIIDGTSGGRRELQTREPQAREPQTRELTREQQQKTRELQSSSMPGRPVDEEDTVELLD